MSLVGAGVGGAGVLTTRGLGGVVGSVQNLQSMLHRFVDETDISFNAECEKETIQSFINETDIAFNDETPLNFVDQTDFKFKDET